MPVLNRLLTGQIQLLAILQRLVNKIVQKGGYLILNDTTKSFSHPSIPPSQPACCQAMWQKAR